MHSDERTVYILRGGSEDEWVSPAPAREVIVDTLVDTADVTATEIDDLSAYVDHDDLTAVVDGTEESVTFTVEGHAVTVTSDGDVRVAE